MFILIGFLIGAGLAIIAHYATLYLVAIEIGKSDNYDGFVRKIKSFVWSLILITFLCYGIFGEASAYMTIYATVTLITLIRVDFEEIQEEFDNIKVEIAKIEEDL